MAAIGPSTDPVALLRSKPYLKLLVLAGLVGVPVSAGAFFFLKLVDVLQKALYDGMPAWWPLPMVAAGGLLAALAITYLPGGGGHSPADGFKAGGVTPPAHLPGVLLAALATLAFGAVLGPEAPLILMGSGLGALAVRLAAKDAPDTAGARVPPPGGFAGVRPPPARPPAGAVLLYGGPWPPRAP